MKNFRENKGITLIALIITIVVLLIIAGISISGGIEGIDKADDNRAMSDLEKVQHAITERYTKFELTKDTSVIVGTKVDTLPTLPTPTGDAETPTWKVFQGGTDENLTPLPEREYYRLSKLDLENLGLTGDYKNSSFIVNYYSGEVFDETVQTTSKGIVLYKTAIENEASAFGDDYVKSGMLAWYDAINNTGSGHSNNTTKWKDLSGNNDGKMTNVTMGNNYAEFNGTNSWVNLGEINDFTNQISIETTINIPISQNDNIIDIICNQHNGGLCLECKKGHMYFIVYFNNIGYVGVYCEDSISFGDIYHVVGMYDGKDMKIYINGTEQEDVTLYYNSNPNPDILSSPRTIIGPQLNTVMALGVNPKGSAIEKNPYKGKIYSTKIYNRALSADEVKHNYLLDKARYGIEE